MQEIVDFINIVKWTANRKAEKCNKTSAQWPFKVSLSYLGAPMSVQWACERGSEKASMEGGYDIIQ